MRIFIIICLLAAGGAFWTYKKFVGSPARLPAQDIIFEVHSGQTLHSVAQALAEKGLVNSQRLFVFLGKVKGTQPKVGEYALSTGMTPDEILKTVSSGKSLARPFTVSEGLNVYEIGLLFEKQKFGTKAEFLKWVFDKSFTKELLGEEVYSLEGYLFPETYNITKFTDAKALITSMVRRFLVEYKDIESAEKSLGWTRHQVVTLASIVEKETGAPEERAQISSVFHNRLQKKMRLQTDPTVLYGILDSTKKYRNNITRNDLVTPNRYNTYTMAGLPFGPICNPGKEALVAAVSPARTAYLYFVSKNEGRHLFSESFEAHTEAVRKYQADPKSREGKSWRNLKKSAHE